ncbi:hypothetical protein M0657_010831 [Pyricularia oryzae]|uniref:Uncharacterized protein n=1 Tax=Pyricularia grisea TaxID=148305 RepID=A0A6P8BIK8_PYRGI|nr:uncharacterized protein PgNI_01118 [Pyricularia grisea]KAI7911650.1 hypothetical protein M0657_010831 [Pyricularia oryzae]TLD16457.1 hypothetical protein PgNI_01118 [Pyricularia grisea]
MIRTNFKLPNRKLSRMDCLLVENPHLGHFLEKMKQGSAGTLDKSSPKLTSVFLCSVDIIREYSFVQSFTG